MTRPEPFSGLPLNSGRQPEDKAAPMGKNEHKQVATHCPSPPLLPAGAPQTSSAPGRAMRSHSERLVPPDRKSVV